MPTLLRRLQAPSLKGPELPGHAPPTFAPVPPIIAGLAAWYKAESLADSLVDSDPVGSWADSSGNGWNALQSTGVEKPLYRTAVLNSLPVVRYDTTDDNLQAAGLVVPQPLTYVVVAKSAAGGGDFGVVMDGATSRVSLYKDSGGTWNIFAGSVLTGPASDANYHIFAAVYNGMTSKLYVDGGVPTRGNVGAQSLNALILGNLSGLGLEGDLAEAFIYSTAVATTDLNLLGSYLAGKWGLTWTPATPEVPYTAALETDTAQGSGVVIGFGPATETDTAQGIGVKLGYGFAAETDTAQGVASRLGYGFALETDTSRGIAVRLGYGFATETDTARGTAVKLGYGFGSETDTARTFTFSILSPYTAALETDTARGVGVRLGILVAAETDTAGSFIVAPIVPLVILTRQGPKTGGAPAGTVLTMTMEGVKAGGAPAGSVLALTREGPAAGGAPAGAVATLTREGTKSGGEATEQLLRLSHVGPVTEDGYADIYAGGY